MTWLMDQYGRKERQIKDELIKLQRKYITSQNEFQINISAFHFVLLTCFKRINRLETPHGAKLCDW